MISFKHVFTYLWKSLVSLAFFSSVVGCETLHLAQEEAARDQLIVRHVKHALYKNEIVPKSGQHFGVTAKKGVVRLTGVADDVKQMKDAVAIASYSQGVIDVENQIVVGVAVE